MASKCICIRIKLHARVKNCRGFFFFGMLKKEKKIKK